MLGWYFTPYCCGEANLNINILFGMRLYDDGATFDKYRSSRQRCSVKKVFLEISQNSQENACARVSFLIKLQASGGISGGIRVRIPQKHVVVAFRSWNLDVVGFQSWKPDVVAFCPLKKCLRIAMSWLNCIRFSMSWFFSPQILMSWFFGLGISMSWFFCLGILMSWYVFLHGLVFVSIVKTEKPRKIF